MQGYFRYILFLPFYACKRFANTSTRQDAIILKEILFARMEFVESLIRLLTTGAKRAKIKRGEYVHVYSNANMLMQLRNVYNNYNQQ